MNVLDKEENVDELCAYIMEHLVLDLDGEVNLETINEMLMRDGSQMARDLRARLIAEQGPDDFLLVLVDCLRESLREGINEEKIQEQVQYYLEA
ncbi:MAG: hypothetical protein JW797_09450 [Bradymonadales bacterium]|nr:hypothetical protein [Bradymonadales bacterium]